MCSLHTHIWQINFYLDNKNGLRWQLLFVYEFLIEMMNIQNKIYFNEENDKLEFQNF
jgi:hypothetical protein